MFFRLSRRCNIFAGPIDSTIIVRAEKHRTDTMTLDSVIITDGVGTCVSRLYFDRDVYRPNIHSTAIGPAAVEFLPSKIVTPKKTWILEETINDSLQVRLLLDILSSQEYEIRTREDVEDEVQRQMGISFDEYIKIVEKEIRDAGLLDTE
jgi:hypothetical protein